MTTPSAPDRATPTLKALGAATAERHPYPADREADVALRDGSTVHIRPVRADDEAAMRAFYAHLSIESRAFRFFSAGANLDRAAKQSVEVDYLDRYALVATVGHDHRIVGHAIYVRLDRPHDHGSEIAVAEAGTTGSAPSVVAAESAFAVADDYQGRGLGTILLAHLAEAAHEAGYQVFVNQVLPDNRRMIGVIRASGFPLRTRSMPGYMEIEVPTSLAPDGLERFMDRDRIAAVAALTTFLRPSSVAVIGASRRRGTVGGELFHNLLATGFQGPVYPVNPSAPVVQSVPAFASVGDIPGPVDLALVAVPADQVADVARACGEAGVRALVGISAGFAETGAEGRARQRELLSICREYGMRLIGPNCMGIMNTDPAVRMNATFSPGYPPRGRIGFLSQSGGLGVAAVTRATAPPLAMSSFVSVGNKADISGNDVIQFWEQDDDTAVILLYLESFGNPRNFGRIARRVSRSKPIVAVKSGRFAAGVRATGSHTGALIAASDLTVDALFRQAGVIRTDTLSELFDVASVLASQPVPGGARVGIVTNGGGAGIVCADACEALGLTVPALSDGTQRRLRERIPHAASVLNPVDLIASAGPSAYTEAIDMLAAAGEVDALIVISLPPFAAEATAVAEAVRDSAGRRHEMPILAVFMSSDGLPEAILRGERTQDDGASAETNGLRTVPSFGFPEEAARALAHTVGYGAWRRAPVGAMPDLARVDADGAAATIASALLRGGGWLTVEEVERLLACYGLAVPPSEVARSARAAGAAADRLGGTVALKALGPGVLHKTDIGAIRLGLSGRAQVEREARALRKALTDAGHQADGFIVQRMVDGGVEMLVGVVHDPLFGPVVAVGAGGTAAELIKDVRVGLTPLTDLEAREMLRSLATFPLLDGFRGAPKADVAALEDVILRVGAMVEAHAEIAELDLNPVIALPEGALVVDARIRAEPAPAARPLLARRSI